MLAAKRWAMSARVRRVFLITVAASAISAATPVRAQDDNDDSGDDKPGAVVSIDLLATYFKGSGFSLGFGLPRLSALTLTSPTSQTFSVDVPLKIELDGWFTVYAGLGGAMSSTGAGPWSSFKPDSWKTGFSADVVTQGDNLVPTVTLSGSVSRPLDQSLLVQTTTWNAGLDLDLAVDAEQTWGLLAGAAFTYVSVDNALGTIHPATMLYAGAYRQIGDWKFSMRGGVQFFRGAQVGNLIQAAPVDIPFVRAELERLDEDDNRLLDVAFAVGWSPKPSFQLTLNVPIYVSK